MTNKSKLMKRSLNDLMDACYDRVKDEGRYDSGIISIDGFVVRLTVTP